MASAATHPTLHRLILLATLLGATWIVANHAGVRYSGQAGVRSELPERVGPWNGEDIFFCQTMTCQWAYARSELAGQTRCARCGGTFSPGSPVEWSLLPSDTEIIKKIYRQNEDPPLVASIVLSGKDRTSIHRPQICLVGGGQEIVATHTRAITLPDGREVKITVLDLLWRGRTADGRPLTRERYFAYWFVGPDHETASHWVRMFWMGFERIFHGVSHRWAYVNVSGPRGDQAPNHLANLDAFIRDFYPQVVRPRADAP